MKPAKDKKHRLALIAGVAWMVCQAVGAQTQPAPQPELPKDLPRGGRILETAPPPLPPRSQAAPDVDASKAQSSAARRANGPKLNVKGFRISGNQAIAEPALLALVKPYEGRELTIEEISEAADLVRDRYRESGYFLAQALVPSQDVSEGIIEIRVVEGALGKATPKVAPEARVSENQIAGYLGLLPSGALINEQSLERPLLLMNDLPATKVRSVLKPGTEFGTADLDVEITRDGNLFGGSAFVDNYGNRNTGEVRLGVDLETRGLMGMGDLLTASLFKAGSLTTLGRLGATLPVGSYGTKLSLSYTALKYEVGGTFSNLNAEGDGTVASLLVQHPIIRSRNTNLFLLAGFDHKDVDDRRAPESNDPTLPTPTPTGERRKVSLLRLGVNGDFRDAYFGGALNSYSVSLLFGNNKFSDPDDLVADQNTDQTAGRFSKIQFEVLRLQSLASVLGEGDSLYLALRGQRALNKNLDSSEKGSLGGPRGVRAFPVAAVAADDLFILTAEYRHRFANLKPLGANVVLSVFYDHGYARLNHKELLATPKQTATLGAVGIGVNVVKKDDFQFRLDVASRASKKGFEGDESEKRTRAWAVLQKWF